MIVGQHATGVEFLGGLRRDRRRGARVYVRIRLRQVVALSDYGATVLLEREARVYRRRTVSSRYRGTTQLRSVNIVISFCDQTRASSLLWLGVDGDDRSVATVYKESGMFAKTRTIRFRNGIQA